MIVCTKTCDSLVKNGLSREESKSIAIRRLADICDKLTIDPALDTESVDAFIISSADLKAPALARAFEAALARKHPEVRVIFINKDKKPHKYSGGFKGIDITLQTPKPSEVSDAIFKMSAKLTEKPTVRSSADVAASLTPKTDKVTFADIAEATDHDRSAEISFDDEDEEPEAPVTSLTPDISLVEDPEPKEVVEHSLSSRMKSAQNVADLTLLWREQSAEAILKQLAKDNAQYDVLEAKIQQLKEEIQQIMLDASIPQDAKLQKIRSIAYDKRFFNLQSNTIIEQAINDIIDTLVSTTEKVLNAKLHEIEESISNAARYGEGQMNFGRLAGLNEERASIVMELKTLEFEIKELAVKAADVCTDLSVDMGAGMAEVSGSDIIDNIIKLNGKQVIDAESFNTVISVISKAQESTEFFQKCVSAVTRVIDKSNALIQADKEMIAVQNEVLRYLQENNIEGTVIANTLLKKSLRTFVGPAGSGRSIITYLLSERKSRESSNVLYMDLTGESKLSRYGIHTMSLNDYLEMRTESQLCVVTGECNTAEKAQSLVAVLTRAADYYRVINLVLSPEQKDVFDILCSDIRAINFITDTKYSNMDSVREFMPTVNYQNVAKRLIVNDCSIPASEVVNFFGLADKLNTQVLTIPHVEQIELAAFREFNPKDVDAVSEAIKEVAKYA